MTPGLRFFCRRFANPAQYAPNTPALDLHFERTAEGKIRILENFVKNGGDINQKMVGERFSLLKDLFLSPYYDESIIPVIKKVFELNGKVDCQEYLNGSPVHDMVSSFMLIGKQKKAIDILLEQGFDINLLNAQKRTPLDMAVSSEVRRFLRTRLAVHGPEHPREFPFTSFFAERMRLYTHQKAEKLASKFT